MGRQSKPKPARAQATKKALAQRAAKEKIKELRPFIKRLKGVDLRRKLSPNQIGFATRAFAEYQELTARPVKIFRSPNKSHLEKAQAYARHDKGKPKFDVAFVPVADPKAKLKFKGDSLTIKTKYVTESVLFFDVKKLAENPEMEIERTLNRNQKANEFVVMAGKYLWNGGIVRSRVPSKIQQLMLRYSDPTQNNYFENWLFGLVTAEYHSQEDFTNYRREYERERQRVLANKQRARDKFRQTYGKQYKCRKCGKKFATVRARNEHERDAH